MNRCCCLTLVFVLASHLPIEAQENKNPPKNFTNSMGMKFVWIPPGTFMMGSPKDEEGGSFNDIVDETQHKVTLSKGFFMGVHLVTQGQWRALLPDAPRPDFGHDNKLTDEDRNLPVEGISWMDCQNFIRALRHKDKKPYRLPTETEWEYACRAGTTTPYHFGNTISTDQANYNGEYSKKGLSRPRKMSTPVGSFPPNAWGLFDMHGNVFQYCQDRYRAYPKKKEVVDPLGPEKGRDVRVLRGGSYDEYPSGCRSAARGWMSSNCPSLGCGFRLCFIEEWLL